MINFRFHIVSLIAIFLALALGIVIGAGVIDRGIVDTLDNRINTIEAKADRIQLENDVLNATVERDAATIKALQPYVLVGRLTGEQVAFVAVRGIDEGRVNDSIAAARQAGATVTGVLWIESKWGTGGDDAKALATAVGDPTLRGAKLRAAAWEMLVTRLARPPLVPETVPDPLTTLQSAGFVQYAEVDGGLPVSAFPGRNALFVLAIGEEGDVPSDNVVLPAATAFSDANVDLTIADVYVDLEVGPARGDVFTDFRDTDLSRTISTVDDLDLAQGPLTVMLALSDLTCVPARRRPLRLRLRHAPVARLRDRLSRPRHVSHRAVRRALAAGAVALVMLLLGAPGWGAAGAATASAADPHAGRVLVLSLPTVRVERSRTGRHAEPAPAAGGGRARLARHERCAVAQPAGRQLRDVGRERARDVRSDDRRPGLRRRRGARRRHRGQGVHDPHRGSGAVGPGVPAHRGAHRDQRRRELRRPRGRAG